MNTNMIGFKWFLKIFVTCALDESSISIGSVKSSIVTCNPTGLFSLRCMIMICVPNTLPKTLVYV